MCILVLFHGFTCLNLFMGYIFMYSALFISSGQFFIVVKYALTLLYRIVEGWSSVWMFLELFVVCVCLASSFGVLQFPLLGYETRSDISEMVCFLDVACHSLHVGKFLLDLLVRLCVHGACLG